MTYHSLEDVYLLDSGRKIKRLEIIVCGVPPSGLPFQWKAMSWPGTTLNKAERAEVATWLTAGLIEWANQDDQEAEVSPANTGPRLIVLDRSSGALS